MSNTSTSHLLKIVDALDKHASMLQQNKQEYSSMGDAESTVELLQWASKQISQLVVDHATNQVVNRVPASSEIVIDNPSHLESRSTSKDETDVVPKALELMTKPRCQKRSTSKDETDVVPKALELMTKPRRLLITNGFEIRFLNLKQQEIRRYESIDDIPPLPKTGVPLKLLLEECYPVVVGLFKLDCDAYMIGGQHLSGYPRALEERCKTRGVGFESFLAYYNHVIKASSRDTYLLSKGGVAADSTVSLLPSKCKIPPLNKPKVWPIIEKIGGLIHVFNSRPRWQFTSWSFLNKEEFSHEVLNPNDVGKGWTEIPTAALAGRVSFFRYHLVVGDRIYLIAHETALYIYDSETRIWEMQSETDKRIPDCHFIGIKRVWHLLEYGEGRCMGEFVHHGEQNERLYMVIAILGTDFVGEYGGDFRVSAIAYLASSTGRVLCYQRLRHFFVGEPWLLTSCTLFNVDEQEMCSFVTARRAVM